MRYSILQQIREIAIAIGAQQPRHSKRTDKSTLNWIFVSEEQPRVKRIAVGIAIEVIVIVGTVANRKDIVPMTIGINTNDRKWSKERTNTWFSSLINHHAIA
jgi:hypothetical protein